MSKYMQALHLLTIRVLSSRVQTCEFDNASFYALNSGSEQGQFVLHSYLHLRNEAFIYPLLTV